MDAPDNRCKWDAPVGMGLGIEEDLRVPNILLCGAFKIGPGQIEEILLEKKHAVSFVIDIQERLEVVKAIRLAEFLDRGKSKGDLVASSNLKHHFGL